MRPKTDKTPDSSMREVVHEMSYPSGGVVLLDAGSLLAATPDDLCALQAHLQRVAGQRTSDGRPFRAQAEDTPVGDVVVAPVRARQLPHRVKIERENGRARRVVVELGKPRRGGAPDDSTPRRPLGPAYATPPAEGSPAWSRPPHPLIGPTLFY